MASLQLLFLLAFIFLSMATALVPAVPSQADDFYNDQLTADPSESPTVQATASPSGRNITCFCSGCPTFSQNLCATADYICESEMGVGTCGNTNYSCFIVNTVEECDVTDNCENYCTEFGCASFNFTCVEPPMMTNTTSGSSESTSRSNLLSFVAVFSALAASAIVAGI